ncbi:MAG: DUF2793 domain-containing protein [Pseudomonadota bacterium]
MDETPNLALPLVQPSQAQKHVTVNEALVRLDAGAQLVLADTGISVPPGSPDEGVCYGVPVGATGAWQGHEGEVAVEDNGGWSFLSPREGWRAWDRASVRGLVHDGSGWRVEGLATAPSGAGARFVTQEALHSVTAGTDNTTALVIPAKSMVFAASARVTSDITGSAPTWSLGVAGATDRFGSGLGMGQGGFADGILGTPQTYYSDTALVISGEGGDLSGGTVRLALHYIAFDLPDL